MTLTEILADVYRRLDYASSPPAAVTTRLTAYANTWHRRILSRPGIALLRDDTYALTSVSGTAEYALPPIIGRVKGIHQQSNGVRLEERSLDWLRTVDPDLTGTGAPAYVYIPLGERHVQKQPSDASEIFVDSTSASDTNTAYIEVTRTGGYHRSLSVSMTGTTAVSLGSAITDAITIDKFYLSAAAVGTVTLHEDASGGTELARIPIGQLYARYLWVRFWPTPAGETYHVDYTRAIVDLANGTDEPLWPADFHWLLVTAVEYEELMKTDDSRAPIRRQELEQGINDLRSWTQNRPDYVIVPGRPRTGRSRLGPNFPAGT